jgi:hypothetical protein
MKYKNSDGVWADTDLPRRRISIFAGVAAAFCILAIALSIAFAGVACNKAHEASKSADSSELSARTAFSDTQALAGELDAALLQVNLRLQSLEDVAENRDERLDAAERRIRTLFQGGECQFDMESGHHAETVAYERQLEDWGNQVVDVVNSLRSELAGVRKCQCQGGCQCGCCNCKTSEALPVAAKASGARASQKARAQ